MVDYFVFCSFVVVMDDGEREHAQTWLLAEDNARIVLLTFSSLALAVASILLWRAKHVEIPVNNHGPDPQQAHSAQSIITAALSTFHIASNTPGEYDMTEPEQPSTPEASTSADADQKASRSKERRRRGKVPFKELLKGGKKTKVSSKANQPRTSAHQDNSGSDSPAFETESKSTTNNNNIAPVAPSTSRLPSPTPDHLEENLESHLGVESPPAVESHEDHLLPTCMSASSSEPASVSRHVTSHNSTMRTSRSEHMHPHDTADNIQHAGSPCHDDPAPSIPGSSSPSTSTEDNDSREHSSSFTSCPQSQSMPLHVSTSTHALDWDGQSQAYRTGAHTMPPRLMAKQRGTDKSNGSCAISASISHNTPLASSSASHCVPPARITLPNSASVSSSPLHINLGSSNEPSSSPSGSPQLAPAPTLPHITFPTLNPLQASPNDHTHTHSSTIESPIMNGKKAAGPSIPTASRGSTPPPGVTIHTGHICSPTGPLSAQTQLASMRGALEAARLREEKARAEAERVVKENEELKWRWNEDTMAWRRREGELQAQAHHLMQQLQAAYSVLATLQSQAQAQSPSSSFSSPTSPSSRLHPQSPNLSHNGLPQNLSHNPPAHVQALLASSYHPYPGFPVAYGGAGVSPLFYTGLRMTMSPGSSVRNGGGKGQYTPDTSSSAGSSPSRGRRRRRGSESSSAQENNSEDMSISEVEEDQEDAWQNSILADAILKRPESLRVPSRGSLRSDGRMSAMGSVPSGKEDVGRVPSRMSERSDASASGGSYGVLSMSSLSWGKSEDETTGAVAEGDSTLAEAARDTKAGSDGTIYLDAPTQNSSFCDPSAPVPAKDVQ
ncbi:hypothetical protein DEU56DRAFT_819726 [Suillus clintonianus]|uniref:uncharacterized protein n=1 Tax=Suillus clintonianus TaxID=1904413 RepID=UPI001B86FC2A|nr:uncharacterized protein DEU56DRAFT_819726 [Suillus clintonianus]KAG2127979.1 hypothetical protein DEU56DRAFT_819726 [Suillus clintonianus]